MALGQPDVDGMLARISSKQFAEWIAFCRVEPLLADKLDIQFAYLRHMIADFQYLYVRSKGWHGQRPKVKDYLVDWWKSAKQTPQQLALALWQFGQSYRQWYEERHKRNGTSGK